MTTPTVLSIQVGLPAAHGADSISTNTWESGIFKHPVEGRVWMDTLNLRGDGQHDLKNHGGVNRAALAYGAAHYPAWRDELDRPDFPYGAFGENFTVSELTESSVFLGDVYAVGEARVLVTQPRWPCWKLARRWNIKDLTARVERKGWGGWYQRVLQPGYIQAGDTYELLERSYPQYSVALLNDLMAGRMEDSSLLSALAQVEALSPEWRKVFAGRVQG